MTDASNSGFGKFVPGFEFMQNLARQAAGGLTQGVQQATPQLPNLGNWVAPTFNVEDLDKRIQELKTVHFWLEQNSRALVATIQALEVQKMTLATLQGMNVSMGDVANAMKLKTADAMASMAGFAGLGAKLAEGASPAQPSAAPVADAAGSAGKLGGTQFAGLEIPPRHPPASEAVPVAEPSTTTRQTASEQMATAPSPDTAAATAPAPSVVDPMQWWGALTQQFQSIAAQAMQELPGQTALEAGKHMATALASEAVKTATEMTTGVARTLTAQADVAATSARGKAGAASAGATPRAASTKATPKATPKAAAKKTASKPAGKVAARAAQPVPVVKPAAVKTASKRPTKAPAQPSAKGGRAR